MQFKRNRIFIILTILLSSVSLQATTFVDEFPIYLYGDVSFYATVYEFIKAFTGEILVGGSAVQYIIGLGATITILIAGYRAKDGGPVGIGKSVIAPMALIALFFVPTVKVHITDLRVDKGLITHNVADGGYRLVEDVPYAIAAIPSISSTIVSFFIDIIDDNWDSVSLGAKFSTIGFQGISRITKQTMYIAKFSDMNITGASGVVSDLHQYISKCMVIEALKTPSNKQTLIHPSDPFPDMLDPSKYDGNVSSATISFDTKIDSSGDNAANITCEDAYAKYVTGHETDLIEGMNGIFEAKFGIDPTNPDLTEAWRAQVGDTAGLMGNIGKAMALLSTSKALEQELEVAGIGVNGVTTAIEISIQSTMSNLRTEGLAKFEWISRTLPDAISILLAVMLGVFPIMILVMSFYGASAFPLIGNYFMGYIALNFNLVGLALVSNIVSYYTAQHAQEAIVAYAGIPFGMSQVNDFMINQADMAGFAGLIGAVAIFGITPLVFKGEAAGLSAGMNAVSGAYRGNVAASAQKELNDYDAQKTIDDRSGSSTFDGMSESEAGAWLSKEGFSKPNSMSAVESYNNMMKNYQQIGSADASSILHSGNMGKFNASNYIDGAGGQAMQKAGATAGLGANMNAGGEHSVSFGEIGELAIQDGEVMGAKLHSVSADRKDSGFSADAVGAGMGHQQVAQEMASQLIGNDENALQKLKASSTNSANSQLASGQGLLNTGAFDNGMFDKTSENGAKMDKAMEKMAEKSAMGLVGLANSADEANGWEDYVAGGQMDGRVEGNKSIAKGEEWQKLNDGEKVDLMRKVKENEKVGTFGGIEATNAEIQEHAKNGDGDPVAGAIKDMVTGAQAKGIQSAADAQTLRKNYDTDNDGNIDDAKSVISDKAKEAAQNTKAQAIQERNDLLAQDSFTANDNNRMQELNKIIATADTTINDDTKMTLADQSRAISQQKLDSQAGQAAGINKNMDAGVSYAQNAMYGETSQQQSTAAKIAAQGGVDSAVSTDVTEAGQKAASQKGAVEGLQSEADKIGEKIGKSAASVMEDAASTMARSKIASDVSGIASKGDDEYVDASRRSGIESASKMAAQFDNAKAVMSKELGREPTDEEIGERLNRENRITEGFKSIPARTGGGIVDAFEHMTGVDINGDGEVAAGVATGLAVLSEIKGAGKGGGVVTKTGKKLGGLGKEAYGKLTGKATEEVLDETDNKSTNKTNNSGTDNKDSQPKKDSVEKTKLDSHSSSSDNIDGKNSPSGTSISKNGESVKPSIASEIDAQNKKMAILNNDAGYTREADAKTAQYKEQVRLNGGATPEMASRYSSDMANIQDSNLKRIESFKSPQSMFSKINDFFGGSDGAKGRLGTVTTLGASMAAGYALSGTSAEASSTPNAKPVLTGSQEALLAGSNVTGAAEMGVGLTTLGASAMSGTVTKDIAKFGSSVILGESILQLTGCRKPIPVRNQHKTDGAYL